MLRIGRAVVVLPLLAGLAVSLATGSPAGAAVRESGVSQYSVPGSLTAICALSASDAWAVGGAGQGANFKTLIVHWNGRVWKRVPSPSPGSAAELDGVAVISARNAWAVGTSGLFTSAGKSLILHWNGRVWRQVPSPNPGLASSLSAVTATSARNAWAVGLTVARHTSNLGTLILHWNGRAWRKVASPSNPDLGLTGVAATSAGNAWATGAYAPVGGSTAILRWNGKIWRQVHTPNPNPTLDSNYLSGVAATTTGGAWAVGGNVGPSKTLILRWTGKAWKQVRSPSPGFASLAGVATVSARQAWAVGTAEQNTSRTKTLILRWNGTAWKQVSSPNPAAANSLRAVIATGTRNAWAVGLTGRRTLILHWNGRIWR